MTMDSVIGVFIVLNAVMIGINMQYNSPSYPDWEKHPVFMIISIFMCILFASELAIKLKFHGVARHYGGADFCMNTFDTCIVISDFITVILEIAASFESPIPPSLFRLVRLVRLTRLLRLIRAAIFSDLLAMISGMLGYANFDVGIPLASSAGLLLFVALHYSCWFHRIRRRWRYHVLCRRAPFSSHHLSLQRWRVHRRKRRFYHGAELPKKGDELPCDNTRILLFLLLVWTL